MITLMLIASAALASLDGLRRSIVLLDAGEIALTIGSLLYSYAAVQGDLVDDRFANLAWAAGAGLSMLAAAAVILRVDTSLGPAARERRLPGHPAGARSVMLVTLVAATVALGVGLYGLLDDHRTVGLVGLLSTAVIAVAMGLRGRDAITSVEHASVELDRALVRSERDRDRLELANAELEHRVEELRTLRVAAARWLTLVDERNDGRLRELVERAGGDLQALSEEHLDDRPSRGPDHAG